MFKSFFTVKNILFLVSIIALLFIIPKIAGILLLFFASYVIACALNPYVEKLQKRKMNRAVASSLVLTASCAGVIAVFLPIFLIAFKEIKTFTTMLPAKIELLTNYLINLDIFGLSIQDIFDKGLQLNKTTDIAQNIFNQSWNFTMALGEFFVGFVGVGLPDGIRGVQDMERVWEAMRKAGITPRQIEKIASGNLRRVLQIPFPIPGQGA